MGDGDDFSDWVYRLYLTDETFDHVNEGALRSGLAGFALEPKYGFAWLANACRWAIHSGTRMANITDSEGGAAAVRDELNDIASDIHALWEKLNRISPAADSAMWNFSWRRWVRSEVTETSAATSDLERFQAIRAELMWLGHFMADSAAYAHSGVKPGKWETTEQKNLRIYIAYHLAAVFEEGFGERATVKGGGSNNQPASLGPWADFVDRALTIGRIGSASSNLEQVLREARKLHRENRALFDPKFAEE